MATREGLLQAEAAQGSGGGGGIGSMFGSALGDVADVLGAAQHGVGYLVHGVAEGDWGDIARGAGILVPAAAGALLTESGFGLIAGAEVGQFVGDKIEGDSDRSHTDVLASLGVTPSKGLLGTVERLGVSLATDPLTYIAPGAGSLDTATARGTEALSPGARLAAESAAKQTGTTVGEAASAALAGDAGGAALRLRVPFTGLGVNVLRDGASDGARGFLAAADTAVTGGRVGDAISGASGMFDGLKAAVVPGAGRIASLTDAGIDADRAVTLNGAYETARAQAQGTRASLLGDFEAQVKAAGKVGGDAPGQVLSQWAEKAGLQAETLDTATVREAVSATANDAARSTFDQSLQQAGIASALRSAGADAVQGVTQGSNAADAMEGLNPMTGGATSAANPEWSALQKLYADQPSLATGALNKAWRQVSYITGTPKFAAEDVLRNAMDPGVKGIGNVAEAASLQRAVSKIPDAEIASKGLVEAARGALTPEQFDLWSAAREQGVLGGGYAVETGVKGIRSKLSAPLRAAGDNSRLANFADRLSSGATAEDAAAGMRGAQFDYSDLTPQMAAARKYVSTGANYASHNAPAMLSRAAANPALIPAALGAKQLADQYVPDVNVAGVRLGVKANPLGDALGGGGPLTAAIQAAGGNLTGAGRSLLNTASGPTAGGAVKALVNQKKGATQSDALRGLLEGTIPGARTAFPLAGAAVDPSTASALASLTGTSGPAPLPGTQGSLSAALSGKIRRATPKTPSRFGPAK